MKEGVERVSFLRDGMAPVEKGTIRKAT